MPHFQNVTCDAITRSLRRRSHSSWQMRAVALSRVRDPHQCNSTSLTVWFKGRFVTVIIEAEINEQSGGQKRRDKSSKEISRGGKSAELGDKGPVLQMARVQRRPCERCDGVKRDTEAQREVRRGTKEGTGSPETNRIMSVNGTGQRGGEKWCRLKHCGILLPLCGHRYLPISFPNYLWESNSLNTQTLEAINCQGQTQYSRHLIITWFSKVSLYQMDDPEQLS